MNSQPNYQYFLNWFVQNGGEYRKIIFPAKITPLNYIGITAKSKINKYEVFLAVPKNIIISTSKVRQSKIGQIFKNYQILSDQQSDQTNFNQLVLFIIWQKMLKSQSFFQPYLNVLEKAQPIIRWSNQDIQKLNDPYISVEFVEYLRKDIKVLYSKFNQIAKEHPQLFKQQIEYQVFIDSYASVMTRSFGWGLPQTMLVPFADFLNHYSSGAQHYVLNKRLEQQKGTYQFQKEYVKKQSGLDISILDIEPEKLQNIKKTQNCMDLRQKFIESNKNILDENKDMKQSSAKLKFIQEKILQQKFNIPLYQSSNSEDNDSQEDEVHYEIQSDKLKLREINKLVKSQMEPSFELEKRDIDKQFDDHVTFRWWNIMNEKQSYFIVSALKDINQGQQIFNSYGRRSNRFLLIWYGFTHKNNKYDSLPFRIWTQNVYQKTGKLLFTRYLTEEDWYNKLKLGNQRYNYHCVSDQYRLKKHHLCYELMGYLRYKIIHKKPNLKIIFKQDAITYHQIVSLQVEKLMLDEYLSVLSKVAVAHQIEKQHTELSTQQNNYFAIILKESKKQILKMHKQGINILKNVIKQLLNGNSVINAYKEYTNKEKSGENKFILKRFLNQYFKMLQKHEDSLKNSQ